MATLLRRIARKIAGAQPAPTTFPGSLDSYPTFILSEDRKAPPPRRLIELSLRAIQCALDEISLDDITKRPTVPDWFTIWPGEHYRLLAGLVKVIQPKVLIEIGTDTGLSSLAMKKYLPPDGKLVTYDLRPWQSVPEHDLTEADFAGGRLEQRLVDLSDPAAFDKNRDLLARAEFFFIDGPKNIKFETAFMKHLATIKFERPPILLFDDTRLHAMLAFWRDLPYPKLDLTSFGHWSGTGMVEFTPK
jgi:hypothetical protein